MDEEMKINDKLKIMRFSLLPCGLKHTPFFYKGLPCPESNPRTLHIKAVTLTHRKMEGRGDWEER